MIKTCITVLLVALCAVGCAQSPANDFSMDAPKDWHSASDSLVVSNLKGFTIEKQKLKELLSDHNQSVPVMTYMKYHPSEHPGLIPTVKVVIRKNPSKDYKGFYAMVEASALSMKNQFADFKVVDGPKTIQIDGRDVFYMRSEFSMETPGGTIYPRTTTYAIPAGDVLYQVNFIDDADQDCSALFKELEQSIDLD